MEGGGEGRGEVLREEKMQAILPAVIPCGGRVRWWLSMTGISSKPVLRREGDSRRVGGRFKV